MSAGWWATSTAKWALIIAAAIALVAVVLSVTADLRWSILWARREFLLESLATSWLLALVSFGLGLVIGAVLAVLRVYAPAPFRQSAIVVIEIARGLPQVIVIFWIYFGVPRVFGVQLGSWTTALVALVIIASSYLAEVVRAGLYSVPRIQYESAYALGMGRFASFVIILLPQALKNMIPSLISHFAMIFKTTSLVYLVGVMDFFNAVMVTNSKEFQPQLLFPFMALVYLVCCSFLSYVAWRIDPKYRGDV